MKICIVGGGIAGLSAAYYLSKQRPESDAPHELHLFEAGGRLGGKLATSEFAGVAVDEGADAFITRVPHALELARELGLGGELVAPAGGGASIWDGKRLAPIVKQQILGVPLDLDELASSGVVSPAALQRVRDDLMRAGEPVAPLARDATVGSVVRQRLGDEIAEQMVFPLIGSINAGNCDRLDVRTTAPLIAAAAESNASLIRGLLEARERVGRTGGRMDGQTDGRMDGQTDRQTDGGTSGQQTQPQSLFLAPKGGMEELARALVRETEAAIHLNSPVESVTLETKTLQLAGDQAADDPASTSHPSPSPPISYDALIMAAPAWASARMFRPTQPDLADALEEVRYCSVAIVTVAFNRADVPGDLAGSGFLVPANQRLAITACSWASSKWPHLGEQSNQGEQGNQRNQPNLAIFRVSVGRHEADKIVNESDAAITNAVRRDLQTTMNITAAPQQVRISRWPDSFPQYFPGHNGLIGELEAELNPLDIYLAGAGYHGIGVPACIASGQRAAAAIQTSAPKPARVAPPDRRLTPRG